MPWDKLAERAHFYIQLLAGEDFILATGRVSHCDGQQRRHRKAVVSFTLLLPSGQFDPIQCLTLLLPLYLLTYFTLWVNLTQQLKPPENYLN